jgi:TolB-like protein/Flp pilus assembly protein TadD
LQYWFENFVLDRDRRELRRGPALLPIEAQVFDLLVFLVANHHRVVSKDDLLASVWGGRIVSESTLFSRINAARRAIGDSGDQQRLIRTIIGKGVRFVGAVREQVASGKPGASAPVPRLSIAVLPFTNLSSDPELGHFADGLADDLTTDLSRNPEIFVLARNTALAYKGPSVDRRQLGRDLGVRYVLGGSVYTTGDQVRMNVQLADAESGALVWANRFASDRSHCEGDQDELLGRLATTLEIELMRAATRQTYEEKPANADASELTLRGRVCRYRPLSAANRQEALLNFERALELDPGSAEAKIGIASTLAADLADGWSSAPGRDMRRAETLLHETLQTGPKSEHAHVAIGLLRRMQRRFDEASVAFEAAMALNRNSAVALFQLGLLAMLTGRPEAAIPRIQKAIRLSPGDRDDAIHHWGLGTCYLLLGETDRALELLLRARAENSRLYYVHLDLAAALDLIGERDASRDALATASELMPTTVTLARLRAYPGGGNARYSALYNQRRLGRFTSDWDPKTC